MKFRVERLALAVKLLRQWLALSVDDIAEGLAEQGAAAILCPFESHIPQSFLGVEGRVGIEDEPVVTRIGGVAPGPDEWIVIRRRLLR
jgi:hypothetical protein